MLPSEIGNSIVDGFVSRGEEVVKGGSKGSLPVKQMAIGDRRKIFAREEPDVHTMNSTDDKER
jgi:hypothetical protein